jgi:hypothetical protein
VALSSSRKAAIYSMPFCLSKLTMVEPSSAGLRAGFFQRGELAFRRALAAGDDRAGVAHALARGAVTPAM